jgi:signal transduction histidine kinase
LQFDDRRRWPRRGFVGAALVTFASGIVTLLVRAGTPGLPARAAVELSTVGALALAAAAAAVLLLGLPFAGTTRWLSRVLGAVTTAVAVLAIAETALRDPLAPTALPAAGALLLLGLALATLDLAKPGTVGLADVLPPVAILVAPLGMREHLSTLAAVLLLGGALALARPERGIVALLAASSSAALMARYVFPAAVAIALAATIVPLLVVPALALYAVMLFTARTLDLADGRRHRLLEVLRDERNYSAMLLHTMNDSEFRLQHRAEELEEANAELRRANKELAAAVGFKSDLIDMVSHELNQPLTSAVSVAELLAVEWDSLDEDIRVDLATKVHRNTGRLAAMVKDLLLLFRLDSGMVTARQVPVPVCAVVESALALLASTSDIKMSVEAELSVLWDREHLSQVLTHLLTNAVEFGAEPIEVSVHWAEDGCILTVRDNGNGIAPELADHLFQRFTRAGAIGASGRKGSGLGLYISAHLVRLNGGEIWYEQADPHGACLKVRLIQPA